MPRYINPRGIPQLVCDAVIRAQEAYSMDGADISVTTLNDAPLQAWLKRKYADSDQLVIDYHDRMRSLMGTVWHEVVLGSAKEDDMVETTMHIEIDGVDVKGSVDLIHERLTTLSDLKFTSKYSVLRGLKPEWRQQLNCYHLMVKENHPEVAEQIERLQIIPCYRDWTERDLYEFGPVSREIEVEMWGYERTRAYMSGRVALHKQWFDSDEPPPMCNEEERWCDPTRYAVMKKGRKSALRVLDSWDEAKAWMDENKAKGGNDIVERPGSDKRCDSYCDYAKSRLCPFREAKEVLV